MHLNNCKCTRSILVEGKTITESGLDGWMDGSNNTRSIDRMPHPVHFTWARVASRTHTITVGPHHGPTSPTWSHGLRNTLRFFKFSFSVRRPVSEDGHRGPSVLATVFHRINQCCAQCSRSILPSVLSWILREATVQFSSAWNIS